MMEQYTYKPRVTGSNPIRGTNHSTARTPLYCGVRFYRYYKTKPTSTNPLSVYIIQRWFGWMLINFSKSYSIKYWLSISYLVLLLSYQSWVPRINHLSADLSVRLKQVSPYPMPMYLFPAHRWGRLQIQTDILSLSIFLRVNMRWMYPWLGLDCIKKPSTWE